MASLFCWADRVRRERLRLRIAGGLSAVAAAIFLALGAHAAGPPQDAGKQLIPFLERETGWYRQVSTFAHGPVTPEEVLLCQGARRIDPPASAEN